MRDSAGASRVRGLGSAGSGGDGGAGGDGGESITAWLVLRSGRSCDETKLPILGLSRPEPSCCAIAGSTIRVSATQPKAARKSEARCRRPRTGPVPTMEKLQRNHYFRRPVSSRQKLARGGKDR